MSRPIIIDTDPGQDDAVAILLALASPDDLDVRAITVVAGNVPLDLTVRNALSLVELAGRADVPVYRGSSGPMLNPLVTAEYVHGPTGLDGADLPEPTIREAEGHAVDRMIEIISSNPGIAVCTLGPMTNLGTALARKPTLANDIGELIVMGGGFTTGGNTTPAAEFNMYVDPHAAEIAFRSGISTVLMPLDVTHKAITTPDRLQRFRDLDTAAGNAVAGMLDFYDRWDEEKYGMAGGPLHDPTVIAYLLEPGMFTGKRVSVDIDARPGATSGMTIMDWWHVTDRERNALVMHDIDADRFYGLLVERIGRL